MKSKSRNYKECYLQYGFVKSFSNGKIVPQCIICNKQLSNDALRPSSLIRHLNNQHSSLKNKPLSFFSKRKILFRKTKTRSNEIFLPKTSISVVYASYQISLMIARSKKPHNIGEQLIKPCILETVKIILGENSCKNLFKLPLSNFTVRDRISDLSKDIKSQVIEKNPIIAFFCFTM